MYSYPPLANMHTRNVPIGHNVYYSPSSRYGYNNPLAQLNALQGDPLAEEVARREELALNRRLQQLRQSGLENHYPRSLDSYRYNDRLELLRAQAEEEERLARLEALRQRQRELEEEERLMMSIAHHRRQLEEEEELLRLSRALRIAEEERSIGRHPESFRPSTAEVSAKHHTNGNAPHPIPSHYYTPWGYLHNESGRTCCRQPYWEPSQRKPTQSAAQVPNEEPLYARLPAKQVEPLMHQLWPQQQSHHERLDKASAPDSNDSQMVDVNNLLKALGVHKPSTETPVQVAKVGNGWPMQKTGEMEGKLCSDWPRADVKHLETNFVPSAKPTPPCTKTESSDSRSIPVIDLRQFLNMLADASYRGQNEGSKASPSYSNTYAGSVPQSQPGKVLEPLKEELERRLGDEHAEEIRDAIEGLLTSIRDNKSPETSTSNPVPPLKSTSGARVPLDQQPQKTKSADKEEPKKIPIKVKFERTIRPTAEDEAGQRIAELEKLFYALRDQFQFPETLDFVTPTTSSGSCISRLAYTTNNHPVRSYAQSLNKLLGELDLIDSQGNVTLRMKRKEVVKKVESALEDLEQQMEGRWKAQNGETRKFKTTIEDVTEEEEASENEDKARGRRSVLGTPGEQSKESRSTESPFGHISDELSSEQTVPIREFEGSDHTATQEEPFPSNDIFEVNNRQDAVVSCVPPSPGMASDSHTAIRSLSPSLSLSSVVPDPEKIDFTNVDTMDFELVESTNESGEEGSALEDEVAEQNGISPKGSDSDVESISSEQWSELETPMR